MSGRRALVLAGLGMAAIATLAGAAALIDFDTAPGVSPKPPAVWPQRSKVARSEGSRQLVVIAHPLCDCTAATLQELSKISGITLSVLFFRPDAHSGWLEGRAWERVRQLSGATAQWDDGGREARLFGSVTSGSVLLYGKSGELLFHGGITASRGHTGQNVGLSELERAIQTGVPSTASTPVFGCSLLTAGSQS